MFTQEKLMQIRNGIKINMRLLKFWTEIVRRQSSNTWLHMKTYNNSVVEIRNVFRKLSLRVNRIIRTDYGPYTLGKIKNPGDITEAFLPKNLKTYLSYRYKDKIQHALRKLDDTKVERNKINNEKGSKSIPFYNDLKELNPHNKKEIKYSHKKSLH
jgi:hypothetical protein